METRRRHDVSGQPAAPLKFDRVAADQWYQEKYVRPCWVVQVLFLCSSGPVLPFLKKEEEDHNER